MSTRKPPSLRARQINRPTPSPAEPHTPTTDQTATRVVRDIFSMPETDYQRIDQLRQACLRHGVAVNKSEVIRAGLILLSGLSADELRLALARVEKVKVGRRKGKIKT